MNKRNRIISICIESVVALSAIIGVILCLVLSQDSFMGGATTLLYFTIQSNIWIAIVLMACAILQTISLVKEVNVFPQWLYNVKLVFTVSITLTGLVFCSMIAPFMGANAWTITNILTHVVVPIGSVVDFLLFSKEGKYTYKKAIFAAIPPIYYLFFALIGYFANWNFGEGRNYPYAFLNYGGSAGVFGFSTDTTDSLFLGSFYWIIILVGFVIGVSMLYTKIVTHTQAKSVEVESSK